VDPTKPNPRTTLLQTTPHRTVASSVECRADPLIASSSGSGSGSGGGGGGGGGVSQACETVRSVTACGRCNIELTCGAAERSLVARCFHYRGRRVPRSN